MKTEEKNKLYEMDLGQTCVVEDSSFFTQAIRVPGGWIFRSFDKSHNMITSSFVPYDNEFWNGPRNSVGEG